MYQYVIGQIGYGEAIRKLGDKATIAMKSEMEQLIRNDTWRPLSSEELMRLKDDHYRNNNSNKRKADESETVHQHLQILPCHMLTTEKYSPTGEFIKVKSRLVANGKFEEEDAFKDNYAPTVAPAAVMLIASIAAMENLIVGTIDVTGAYLKGNNLPEPIYMRLDSRMTKLAIQCREIYKNYVLADGTIVVQLIKPLYGLKEAAKLWNDNIHKALIEIGYKQTKKDQCIYYKCSKKSRNFVTLHVDDLFLAFKEKHLMDELITHLKWKYKEINYEISDNISYLGMQFKFDRIDKSVTITQHKCTNDILEEYQPNYTAENPANLDLFEDPPSEPFDSKNFTSLVMKLMYLALRTRPDILLPVSFLATRSQNPSSKDAKKLMRIVEYLNKYPNLGITLRPDTAVIFSYMDASYAVHWNALSHTGFTVQLGEHGGPLCVKSSKQKLVATSSTEAELIALHDHLDIVLWLRELLIEFNYDIQPATIYQDNQSTIKLADKGHGNFKRTKHINVRYFYIKQCIDLQEIELEYLPTDQMVADILTKPLQGNKFRELRAKLMNLPI